MSLSLDENYKVVVSYWSGKQEFVDPITKGGGKFFGGGEKKKGTRSGGKRGVYAKKKTGKGPHNWGD